MKRLNSQRERTKAMAEPAIKNAAEGIRTPGAFRLFSFRN